jgi:YD repeat-containing protein
VDQRVTAYDGLGRPTQSRLLEPSGDYTATDQTYDGLGRRKQVSSPHRSAENAEWTTTLYDSLGRLASVSMPGGAAVTTTYIGSQVTVSDPAGKVRRTVYDALGRVVQVIEDPGGLNHLTNYGYDASDNLTAVSQTWQGQTASRSFYYDSLSRLIGATNPESGHISYQAVQRIIGICCRHPFVHGSSDVGDVPVGKGGFLLHGGCRPDQSN